jgi:hypothetical protein
MSDVLPIASFKLRFVDDHVRAVPERDARGCPFAGPGVDLRGDDAREIFALAAPIVAWLTLREPVQMRTLSMDRQKRRLLVTAHAELPGERPRVIRIDEQSDPSSIADLLALAEPLVRRLGELAADALAKRARA